MAKGVTSCPVGSEQVDDTDSCTGAAGKEQSQGARRKAKFTGRIDERSGKSIGPQRSLRVWLVGKLGRWAQDWGRRGKPTANRDSPWEVWPAGGGRETCATPPPTDVRSLDCGLIGAASSVVLVGQAVTQAGPWAPHPSLDSAHSASSFLHLKMRLVKPRWVVKPLPESHSLSSVELVFYYISFTMVKYYKRIYLNNIQFAFFKKIN